MSRTHAATQAAAPDRAARLARLRTSSFGAVVMLIAEFILGVIYNLYGTAPTPAKPVGLFSSPDLALHVVLGILLFIAAAGQLIRAITIRHAMSIGLSALGMLAIVAAGGTGLGFAHDGAAGASLGMSLAFAVALACYGVLTFALPSGGAAGPSAGPSAGPPRSTT